MRLSSGQIGLRRNCRLFGPRVGRQERAQLAEHSGRGAPNSLALDGVHAIANQTLADRAFFELHRSVGQERLHGRLDDPRDLVWRGMALRPPLSDGHHRSYAEPGHSEREDLQNAGHSQAASDGVKPHFFGGLAQGGSHGVVILRIGGTAGEAHLAGVRADVGDSRGQQDAGVALVIWEQQDEHRGGPTPTERIRLRGGRLVERIESDRGKDGRRRGQFPWQRCHSLLNKLESHVLLCLWP